MTPRQRYPEIWAATYGAAWMSLPEVHDGPTDRAAACQRQADAACDAFSDLLDRRANEGTDEPEPPHA